MVLPVDYEELVSGIRYYYRSCGYRYNGPVLIQEVPAVSEERIPCGDYTDDIPAMTLGADIIRKLPIGIDLDRTMYYDDFMSIALEVYAVEDTYSIIIAKTDHITCDKYNGYDSMETVGITIYGIYDPID